MNDVPEMIQRAARAIERAELDWKREHGGDAASCVDCPDEIKARAAIEALREPTEGMISSFANTLWREQRLRDTTEELVSDVWGAMIDAALR